MHLVAAAWIYVVAMMTLAEAMAPNGTVLGAVFTFLLYGLLPLSIVLYVMATPMRKRARLRAQAAAEAASAADPDRRGQTTSDTVAPIREEP
jgi:membrane protein implicated in regulation of membrane protease activity